MYMDLVIIECQLLFQILCLLLDTDMDKEWSTKTMEVFYGHLVTIDCYKEYTDWSLDKP